MNDKTICRARCPHRAGENHKPFVTNLQTICRGRWALPNIPHINAARNLSVGDDACIVLLELCLIAHYKFDVLPCPMVGGGVLDAPDGNVEP